MASAGPEQPKRLSADSRAYLLGFAACAALLGLVYLLFSSDASGPGAASRAAPEVWFDELGGSVRLPAIDDATLTRFISSRMLANESSAETFPPELVEDQRPRIVFLSLSDGRGPGRVVRGLGFGLATALERAAAAAGAGWERGWVRIDLVDRVDGEDRVEVRPPLPMERGIHGLAFARDSALAFAPGEVMAADLVDDRLELRPRTILEHLKVRDPEAAGRFEQMLEARTQVPYRFFSTRSYFLDPSGWIPLFRGHRTFPDLDREGLLAAARRGGEYLVRAVMPDGRFVYSYEAGTGQMASGYNMLRHAGTAYSMLELYRTTGDPALANAARTAISYLRRNVAPCRFGGQEYSCVLDDGEIKLGGNALGVIAFVEYERATGDRAHRPVARALARWIQAVQSADGEFEVHKQIVGEEEPADFESAYYPGEALLALVRLYELERDESLLDAAERGARWLIEVRDGQKMRAQLDHDHWLLYALNELHRRRPAPRNVDHAAKIAEAIYVAQLRAPRHRDWIGGWYEPPRSTPAAVRAEGLAAAWALTRDYGRQDRLPAILESIRMSVRFQLQTQIGPEQALYFPDPQRALGGFHRSLTRYEIRNDYVQHNISALLGLARILEDS